MNTPSIANNVQRQQHESRDVETTSCCIVGGGPAGAILALLLARRGVPATLLEMHKDFDREFRGDTVHPSILEVLDQIGLADKLLEVPHSKITGPTLQFANGPFRPFNLARLKTRFPYIAMIPQARFLEFITREAAKYPEFRLVMHAQVQHLIEENGTVAGVRYLGDGGAEHELRAQLTVGTDGRFSTVRRLAGFEPIKTAPPMDVLWFRLPKLPDEPDVAAGAFGGIGRGRIFVVLDRDDHWQAGLVFPVSRVACARNRIRSEELGGNRAALCKTRRITHRLEPAEPAFCRIQPLPSLAQARRADYRGCRPCHVSRGRRGH